MVIVALASAALGLVGPPDALASVATVHGQLRDSRGEPIANVNVQITSTTDAEITAGTTTASDGSYSLRVPSGTYKLLGGTSEYEGRPGIRVEAEIPKLVVTEDVTEDLDIPMQLGSVTVHVVDTNGNAAEANIGVRGGTNYVIEEGTTPQGTPFRYGGTGHSSNCSRGSECTFEAVASTALEFNAGREGETSTEYVGAIATNPGSELLLKLPAQLMTVRGVIKDGKGNAIAQVSVQAVGPEGASTTTASDGSYSLRVPSGTYKLFVDTPEYEGRSGIRVDAEIQELVVMEDVTEDLDIPMQLGSVTVHAVDADGNPVEANIDVRGGTNFVIEEGTTPQGTPFRYGGTGHSSSCSRGSECAFQAVAGTVLEFNAGREGESSTGYVQATATTAGSEVVLKLPSQLLTVHGVLRDSQGKPIADASVGATNKSDAEISAGATTAPDGSYSLRVPSGTYKLLGGTLEYEGRSGIRVEAEIESLVVTGDVTEDLDIPMQLGSVTVHVVDANGNPTEANIGVRGGTNFVIEEGTTPQGTPFRYGGLGHRADCSRGSECTFEAVAGTALEFDAVPDGEPATGYVPATATVGGREVVLKRGDFANVTSTGTSAGTVTVTSPTGTMLSTVTDEPVDEHSLPNDAEVVVGGLAYQVSGIAPGGRIDVTLHLPSGSNPTNILKSVDGSYVDVTSLATISGSTITLHLIDGGQGDADGKANGVIVDPVVPVRIQQTGPTPVVKKLAPKKGAAAGGTPVTLTGTGLSDATGVRFGSGSATSFKVNSATSITAVSPPGTAGSVDVVVIVPGGASAISAKDRFTYESPTVTGVTPNSGPVGGGTSATVTGIGFAVGTGTTSFEFGKALGSSVSCSSTTSCTVVAPAAKKAGIVDVIAMIGNAKSKKSRPGDQFTYH